MVMCWTCGPLEYGPLTCIASDFLDSDHLPIVFQILGYVKIKKRLDLLEKFSKLERFQNLLSNLISPRIEIISGVEANKTALKFTASISSAYRLSTSKARLSEVNNNIPVLDSLLKQKRDPE
jgi:hypothetical protein